MSEQAECDSGPMCNGAHSAEHDNYIRDPFAAGSCYRVQLLMSACRIGAILYTN
jgi:hypothetical protein